MTVPMKKRNKDETATMDITSDLRSEREGIIARATAKIPLPA